jgi:hypothetical protein
MLVIESFSDHCICVTITPLTFSEVPRRSPCAALGGHDSTSGIAGLECYIYTKVTNSQENLEAN